ncbi:hypothetical protein IMT09_02775 [Burkholderia cepacia]|nr:hypothetical protein [Burkholderia cepacia]
MTEHEIFFLSSDNAPSFSLARVWTRIAVNIAPRRFALKSNPECIECHQLALGIHLFRWPFQRQRCHTRAPALRRRSRSRHCGPTLSTTGTMRRGASDAPITQDMLSGILPAITRDALGIMRSCMPCSLLHTATSNAPHTAITRTRFQNAHGLHIAHTEVTLDRENKLKNE